MLALGCLLVLSSKGKMHRDSSPYKSSEDCSCCYSGSQSCDVDCKACEESVEGSASIQKSKSESKEKGYSWSTVFSALEKDSLGIIDNLEGEFELDHQLEYKHNLGADGEVEYTDSSGLTGKVDVKGGVKMNSNADLKGGVSFSGDSDCCEDTTSCKCCCSKICTTCKVDCEKCREVCELEKNGDGSEKIEELIEQLTEFAEETSESTQEQLTEIVEQLEELADGEELTEEDKETLEEIIEDLNELPQEEDSETVENVISELEELIEETSEETITELFEKGECTTFFEKGYESTSNEEWSEARQKEYSNEWESSYESSGEIVCKKGYCCNTKTGVCEYEYSSEGTDSGTKSYEHDGQSSSNHKWRYSGYESSGTGSKGSFRKKNHSSSKESSGSISESHDHTSEGKFDWNGKSQGYCWDCKYNGSGNFERNSNYNSKTDYENKRSSSGKVTYFGYSETVCEDSETVTETPEAVVEEAVVEEAVVEEAVVEEGVVEETVVEETVSEPQEEDIQLNGGAEVSPGDEEDVLIPLPEPDSQEEETEEELQPSEIEAVDTQEETEALPSEATCNQEKTITANANYSNERTQSGEYGSEFEYKSQESYCVDCTDVQKNTTASGSGLTEWSEQYIANGSSEYNYQAESSALGCEYSEMGCKWNETYKEDHNLLKNRTEDSYSETEFESKIKFAGRGNATTTGNTWSYSESDSLYNAEADLKYEASGSLSSQNCEERKCQSTNRDYSNVSGEYVQGSTETSNALTLVIGTIILITL